MEKQKAFDRQFEEKIPHAMLLDSVWAEQLTEVLDESLFDLLHTRHVAKILKEFYINHKCFPSLSLLESICAKDISDDTIKKRCLDYLEKIKQNPLNGDIDYVKEKSLEFFKLQALANCLSNDILPRIESGKNLEDITSIIQKVLSKGTSRDIGYEYHDDEELRFIETSETKIPSGWEYLDKLLGGGFGAKRLVTFIGAAGAGKSSCLVGTGVGALLAGKTVAHYTLELDEIDVARKYDACLTGIEINAVVGNKAKVLQSIKSKLSPEAKLIIKEYPMKSASVQTIKSHLARLKLKGIIPDIIIIDYGDLLRNIETSSKEDRRHGLESIWQDMKALAQTLGIPVVTATQTNRSGYNADLITPDQVSEDFSKIMTSDIVITLARNMAQKIAGLGKMYLAKNRQGQDGIIYAYSIETAKCLIKMFELTPEMESEMNPEEKPKSQSMQEKVASFLVSKKK
jgi:replicative DNA helicase